MKSTPASVRPLMVTLSRITSAPSMTRTPSFPVPAPLMETLRMTTLSVARLVVMLTRKACGRSTPRTNHVVPCGTFGVVRRIHPISEGVRSPFVLLHARQQAARFSQLSAPPRERGSTWSIVVAPLPQ